MLNVAAASVTDQFLQIDTARRMLHARPLNRVSFDTAIELFRELDAAQLEQLVPYFDVLSESVADEATYCIVKVRRVRTVLDVIKARDQATNYDAAADATIPVLETTLQAYGKFRTAVAGHFGGPAPEDLGEEAQRRAIAYRRAADQRFIAETFTGPGDDTGSDASRRTL
ncbi:hypothetical protein [Pseudoxanthomonas suwonensis]|uniref:hypothetical protein n=1 Tax=Pseudoxanthomonas suwonensis TaxID=314722 RepID=UPI0012DD9A09|nr:hypothetical protein [Pseudoxanthomonas suwonensis]